MKLRIVVSFVVCVIFIACVACGEIYESVGAGFELNDVELPYEVPLQTIEVSPQIINGCKMVSIREREIFEALNIEVYWYTGTGGGNDEGIQRQISAIRNSTIIEFITIKYEYDDVWPDWRLSRRPLPDAYERSDNHPEFLPLDSQPMIVDDCILVPIMVITEAFDICAEWNYDTQTLIITADVSGAMRSADEMQKIEDFTREMAYVMAEAEGRYYIREPWRSPGYSRKGKYFEFGVLTLEDKARIDAEFPDDKVMPDPLRTVEGARRDAENGVLFPIKVYMDGTIVEFLPLWKE